MQRFIATLRSGNTSCADEPAFVPPAVPEFPRTAGQATPARALAEDVSTIRDRRVVTVSVRAALDALLRSFRIPGATGTGYGLRGGTFDFDFGDEAAILMLDGVRFTRGVEVDGRLRWAYNGSAIHMKLTVRGPGGHDGTLEADGVYGFGQPYRAFRVIGELSGRDVVARVPAK